jgi:hypothetical protein
MVTVVERSLAHYERQEEAYGETYVWCPECVVVECGCGERLVLTASDSACGCGADHAALIARGAASRRASQGASGPWRDEHPEWWERQDEYLRSESQYSQELEAVE